MRPLSKILAGLCWALFSAAAALSARPAGELVPAGLRQLAARAAKPDSWPRLRRYAGSRKDPEQRGLAFFTLGYREYEAREYSAALMDLREAAVTSFSLADQARYFQAAAARRASEPLQVAEALGDFWARFPESPLRWRALELLAEAWLDAREPLRAVQILAVEPRARQHPALALLLAQAYFQAERFQDAARTFQDVYFAFPTTPQAKAAGEALDELRSKLGAAYPSPTEEIQTARAESLFKASRFEEARQEYEELLSAHSTSSLVSQWGLGRARCLLRLGHAAQALEALSLSFAANPAMDAERLALIVEAQAQQGNATAMLETLAQIQSRLPQPPAYAAALFAAGNFYYRQLDWRSAGQYYQPLAELFPQNEHARDATWRLAWSYYLGQDRDRAREALKDHITRYPDSPRAAAALYWLGRLKEEQGAILEARAIYELLRKRFVHSYFAIQAGQREQNLPRDHTGAARLKGLPAGSLAATLAQTIPPPELPPSLPCASAPSSRVLLPALVLQALSLENLAEEYLQASLSERPSSPELRFFLGRLEADEGNASGGLFDAIKVAPAYSELDFATLPKELWNLLYPRSYWKLVERQARANRLDPYLVMGLIRQESAFNPRAVSRADARGLMQILPATASRSRRRSHVRAVAGRLYDPAYNVRVGCAYLRALLKQFNGTVELALAAYHAGDFRVNDWLNKSPYQGATEFLETIPIPATRLYVELVLRDAAVYRQLMMGSPKFLKCSRESTVESREGRSLSFDFRLLSFR